MRRPVRFALPLIVLALGVTLSPGSLAAIYKCEDAEGRVTFQQAACDKKPDAAPKSAAQEYCDSLKSNARQYALCNTEIRCKKETQDVTGFKACMSRATALPATAASAASRP